MCSVHPHLNSCFISLRSSPPATEDRALLFPTEAGDGAPGSWKEGVGGEGRQIG